MENAKNLAQTDVHLGNSPVRSALGSGISGRPKVEDSRAGEIGNQGVRAARGRAAAITSHPLPCDDVGAEHNCGVSSGEQVVNDLKQRAGTPHRTGRDPYRDLMTHIIGID